MTHQPLQGIVVVALEQALAAPYCSSRLADAGARVIKIERPEGDFARGHDTCVNGESACFVWVNRGKESVALDLGQDAAKARLSHLVAEADVFIQNLASGAAARLGFESAQLRQRHPRLITCDISGYGDSGPLHGLKAHDRLVQAESGLMAASGATGVPICDITAGMNAVIGIQQALLQRERTGRGSGIKVSLFDSAADLMAVPYLQARYGNGAPDPAGHSGTFSCSDGRELVLAFPDERAWPGFCAVVLQRPELASDPRFDSNSRRAANHEPLQALIQSVFSDLSQAQAVDRLTEAQTPYGAVNSVHDLIQHPQLRTRDMVVHGRTVRLPAPPCITEWDDTTFAPVPQLDEHAALPGR